MSFFGIIITVVSFAFFYSLRNKKFFSKIPVILSAGFSIILIMKIFNIEYEQYYESAKYLTGVIGPITLSLAYPLYENKDILLKNKRILYSGMLLGTITAAVSTYICASLFNAQFKIIASMLPKSTTMPIAIEISKTIGGFLELTACVVVITGVLGGIFGHWVLKKIGVKNDIAIGLAIGSASHIIGTAACADKNKQRQVASSTIALILVGMFSAILIPLAVHFLNWFWETAATGFEPVSTE